MSRTLAYHRPSTLQEALDLLAGEASAPRVLLGGGTDVNPDSTSKEVVDLQALGLDGITDEGGSLRIGAMVRLQDLVDDARVPGTVRDAARAEQPSTLRTIATVGGTIGSRAGDSLLLATLLANEVEVSSVSSNGTSTMPIEGWLAADHGPAIITEITLATTGSCAIAATGRTPADVPIVAAVGCARDGHLVVAVTGVAPTPVIVDHADPTRGLTPGGDFRGSAAYRLRLVDTLTARVTQELS